MSDVRAHVDFESFSELSIKDVGTCRMAEHPSTEALCMGWAIGDDEPLVWVPSRYLRAIEKAGFGRPHFHSDPPHELFEHIEEGGLVCAWNVEMEIPFWEEVMSDAWAWPIVPRDQWRDTGANALMLSLPANLEMAGEALGLDIVKDRRGKHLLNKLAKPRRPSKKDPRTRWEPAEVPKDYADLYEYCGQDVRAERAVDHALPINDLPPEELVIWRMTTEMNLRGWAVDIESARLVLELMERYKVKALAELKALTGNRIQTGGQVAKMRDWLADEHDVHLESMGKDLLVDALKDRDLPKPARRLIELRQVLSKSSTAKYVAMQDRICDDGTVKNNILYHGAGTGRDAGRGLQIQNFPRSVISGDQEIVEAAFQMLRRDNALELFEAVFAPMPLAAAQMLRPHMIARPGYELFAADFSSIENRMAAWVSDCEYGIDIFNRGLDEYKQFASKHYEVGYDEVTPKQRQHGKEAILLCVFGGGAQAMVNQAIKQGSDMELSVAKETVDSYRELYHEVAAMWYGLAREARRCVKSGDPKTYGKIGFRMHAGFLRMRLPSGRELAYHAPLVEMKKAPWGKSIPTVTHMGLKMVQGRTVKKWERQKITPGRFFENVVQAAARDAMMHGALATTAAGYRLIGRVHDELVSERPIGEGSIEEYSRLMSTPPSWLTGIRIEAEGYCGPRYRKG